MHTGYIVYFHEKGIGELKWGILARFSLSQKDEAVDMVRRLKSGELVGYDCDRFRWLDSDKYDFGYMETCW